MQLAFGDVVLVPFPFSDESTTKQRPAAVISTDRYQRERPDVIIPAITSQVRPILGFGEALVTDWQAARLIKPSVFKPLITTIEQNLVIKKLGTLAATDQQALREVLRTVLG
jgi:mRNA interferase MazF